MIRLSVNVLTSAIILLNHLKNYCFVSLNELTCSKIAAINAIDVFVFSCNCGWAYMTENKPSLTRRGIELLQLQEQGNLLDMKRQMLMDYIMEIMPIWVHRIPFGRQEAAIFMSKDEKASFSEALLFSKQIDNSVVDWWDTIATQIRMRNQENKNNTGRVGEKNTITYERQRTKIDPIWMSIDSNLVGYDIKSRVSKESTDILLIEVKTSTCALSQATFYVSAHEWNVALTSSAYVFHLWCLSREKKLLAVISVDDIREKHQKSVDAYFREVFSC